MGMRTGRRGDEPRERSGNVIILAAGHARASSWRDSKLKSPRATVCPFPAKASDTSRNFSAGIRPRDFQLLTADVPTPQISASLAAPPAASIKESKVEIMQAQCSQNVDLSTDHILEIATACEQWQKSSMISEREFRRLVGYRLALIREGEGLTQGQFAKKLRIGKSAISMKEAGDRGVDGYQALILKHTFEVPFDWLFAGIETGLSDRTRATIAKGEAVMAEKRAAQNAKRRRPRRA